MNELIKTLRFNDRDLNLRCIILSSYGSVFSAGHNLKELTIESGNEIHRRIFETATKLMLNLRESPVPIIAKVDGIAAAAGCQLVAACDLVVCTENSSFSTPGSNFGIFCSTPGIALSRVVPQKQAMHMLLTGLPITAQEALRAGLVSKICKDNTELDKEMERICNAIKSKSRSVVERGKRFFYEQNEMTLKSAYKYGEHEMVDNLQTNDGQEGVRSFVEKRKPLWSHFEDKKDS